MVRSRYVWGGANSNASITDMGVGIVSLLGCIGLAWAARARPSTPAVTGHRASRGAARTTMIGQGRDR